MKFSAVALLLVLIGGRAEAADQKTPFKRPTCTRKHNRVRAVENMGKKLAEATGGKRVIDAPIGQELLDKFPTIPIRASLVSSAWMPARSLYDTKSRSTAWTI